MSDIQDEAYSEAMQEIEQLKKQLRESRAIAEQDLLNEWGRRYQKSGRCPFCGAEL